MARGLPWKGIFTTISETCETLSKAHWNRTTTTGLTMVSICECNIRVSRSQHGAFGAVWIKIWVRFLHYFHLDWFTDHNKAEARRSVTIVMHCCTRPHESLRSSTWDPCSSRNWNDNDPADLDGHMCRLSPRAVN